MKSFLYIIISLFLFLFAPYDYSFIFCAVCATVYALHSVRVIKNTHKHIATGIIEFNILFLVSAFAVIYVFPLFIYGVFSEYSFQQLSLFRDSSVNKVTALCTFAYSIYLSSFEHSYFRARQKSYIKTVQIQVTNHALHIAKILSIISVVVFTINILFFVRTIDAQHNELTVNPYIAELTKCILIVYAICCCERYKEEIRNNRKAFFHNCFFPIICFTVIILEYFYIGDRGFIIVGVLTLVFLYNYYVRKIKTVIVVPIAVVAIIGISLIGQLRKTDSSIREGGLSAFSVASSELVTSQSSWLEYISDLTLVSNVAYLEWDYNTGTKFYNPSRILVIISMPVPLAPTLISNILYGNSTKSASTASVVTQFYQNMTTSMGGDGGLGTQAVMDLYMSWNILGVILGMWLLGLFIGKASAVKDYNVYFLLILITHFGLAIYLPRSTVYMCFRTVVWEIVLLNLITKVEKKIIQR